MICFLTGGAALYFFVANVTHYYFVGDDAYISFRYAANLVDGLGLVWNPGEAVEGYTNFLWVLLMAGSLSVGVPPEIAANVISIGCSVLLLMTFLYLFSNLHGMNSPWTWLPLLVLSLSASFTAWSTSGLETMFFSLLLFGGFILFIRERNTNAEFPVLSSVAFAVATLTRPDGGVFIIAAGLFFLFDIVWKKRSFRSGVIWALPYIAIVGAHFLWRYSYYGYWLPNTFYAKVAGLWLAQGVNYLWLFGVTYRIVWFIPFALVPVIVRRDYTSCLFFGVVINYLLYILYVGGDAFEFRFLVVVFPYLYWLIVDGIALVFSARLSAAPLRYGAMFVAVIATAGLLWTTHYGAAHPIAKKYRHGNGTLEGIQKFANGRVEQASFIKGLIDKGVLPEDLVIGVGASGAVPYFTGLPTVDRRGLNDTYIAHMPLKKRGRIAHEHNAPYDYLVKRKVVVFDIFNQLVFPDKEKITADKKYFYDNREARVRAVEVDGQYLIFATFVSDEMLNEVFRGLPVFKAGGG